MNDEVIQIHTNATRASFQSWQSTMFQIVTQGRKMDKDVLLCMMQEEPLARYFASKKGDTLKVRVDDLRLPEYLHISLFRFTNTLPFPHDWSTVGEKVAYLNIEDLQLFASTCLDIIPIVFAYDTVHTPAQFNHDHLKKLDIEQIAENAHPVESGAGAYGWSVNPVETKE